MSAAQAALAASKSAADPRKNLFIEAAPLRIETIRNHPNAKELSERINTRVAATLSAAVWLPCNNPAEAEV
jgi:hypothetical protein